MVQLSLSRKLAILSDAAKYDASCASSGTEKRSSLGSNGIGSTEGSGICHSYAPDGRCISLLKILLTNFCTYDCAYCVNRSSSNVERARFSVDEVVRLTLDFYKRNYIEGLFLSSGIIRSPDYTMGEVVRVARTLREDHDFRGYIHLKTIPDASADLLAEAEGLDKIFIKAGFEWREPGCSMCLAMNPDKLKPEERCASTSNRNFEGRQGFKGRTHLVSPAMAAAAAIAGHFVDVRDWR